MIYELKAFADYTKSFLQRVKLDGVEYGLLLRWNAKEEAYYVSLYYQGELILGSVKAVQGYDILQQFKAQDNMPQGRLYFYDIEGGIGVTPADPDTIGGQVRLYYEEL